MSDQSSDSDSASDPNIDSDTYSNDDNDDEAQAATTTTNRGGGESSEMMRMGTCTQTTTMAMTRLAPFIMLLPLGLTLLLQQLKPPPLHQ